MKRIQIFIGVLAIIALPLIFFAADARPPATSSETPASTDTGERTKVLIDFTQYEERNANEGIYAKENPPNWEKDLTRYVITKDDMKLDSWLVRFNSSSDIYENRKWSRTQAVKIAKGPDQGKTVLGAKIHYPEYRADSHAIIMPPYEIMEFDDNGKMANVGNGVVENVYTVKELSVEVSGRNYDNKLFVRVIDQNRKFRDFYVGDLNFSGWRKLTWKNPYYLNSVDQRELARKNLYPKERPYFKFYAFVVSRPYEGVQGDFVVYFKRVTMNYDLFNVEQDDLNIDDEASWGIERRRRLMHKSYLKKVNASTRELRLYEEARMGKNLEKTPEDKPATSADSTTKPTN